MNHLRSLMSGISPMRSTRAYQGQSHEMASALSLFAEEPEARVALTLALVGLRPSDAMGGVDLDRGVLHMRRSAWRSTLSEGDKGKNSAREVTLGPTVLAILAEYREVHPFQNGFVLENTLGNMLDL